MNGWSIPFPLKKIINFKCHLRLALELSGRGWVGATIKQLSVVSNELYLASQQNSLSGHEVACKTSEPMSRSQFQIQSNFVGKTELSGQGDNTSVLTSLNERGHKLPKWCW